MRRPDVISLVAGLTIAVFGVLLLLDADGVLRLRFEVLGPAAFAMVGAILLADGLGRPS
jgi:hypothetical protein